MNEHAYGRGFTHHHVLGLQSDAIVVYGMGPRALSTFQNARVVVLRAIASTISELDDAYKGGRFEELIEVSHHAHHH